MAGGFNVLFGPSGCGKSFLALDWSACIAAGLSWYGQASMQGPVVYISAEGAGGLKRRYAAWKHARGVDSVPGLTFIPEAVNLLDPAQVVRVQDTIDALGEPPAMFVVDTMARSMVGGDENSSKDVGLLIDHIDVLKERYRSAALTVHHTGTEGERERIDVAARRVGHHHEAQAGRFQPPADEHQREGRGAVQPLATAPENVPRERRNRSRGVSGPIGSSGAPDPRNSPGRIWD